MQTTTAVDYAISAPPHSFTETDYAAIDVKHTLVGTAGGNDPDTGDIYRGLDRFGRVKDCYWYDYGSSADILRIKHGHDRTGNRLYREEADTSDLDQLYSYDDVNRLTQSEEGTLSGTKDSVSSLNFEQQWSLDATGNWSGFKDDDDGDSTWDLDQSRTANKVNEITDVTETAGPNWLTPAYNRAGNMTTIPQPGDPTQSYTATYDAWNRLVKLEEGEDTVAEYIFDGAKRLVVRKKYVSGSLDQTRHFYHTAQWQTIEERLESGGQIASTADRQFTWGPRYIDDLVCRTVNSVHDYAYQDANWNVVLSSSALARVVYQPYGQIRSTCPAAQGYLDTWQHYFAGYRRDEDTGLYLVRHRVYQPELGCWLQQDPIGYGGGIGLGSYAASNPSNIGDPTGTSCVRPEGVQYIPDRGRFEDFRVGLGGTIHPAPQYGYIQADMWAKWKPDAKEFGDKSCCCCNDIGWVQVFRAKATWNGIVAFMPPDIGNWRVDGGIPIPTKIGNALSHGNPCTLQKSIAMGDYPARPTSLLFSTLLAFEWEAEICVICLSGQEGPRTEIDAHFGRSERKLRGIGVYGCAKWNWRAKRTATGGYDSDAVPNGQDLAPSPETVNAISDYYYTYQETIVY